MNTKKKRLSSPSIQMMHVCFTHSLAEEAGEAVGKIAKHLRGDGAIDFRGLEKELGDVLWALANVADDMGSSLSIIARQNLEKLEDRKARGVITGSGDNR